MILPALPARLRRGTARDPLAPLHGTAAELLHWRTRATDPAFATSWQRVTQRADTFLGRDPTTTVWPGNQLEEPWNAVRIAHQQQAPNRTPGRRRGDDLRDAAFVALLAKDPSARAQVLAALEAQIACPGTAFADRTRWDPTRTGGDYNNFEIANWLRKLAYGYSYIRAHVAASRRSPLDAWFTAAGAFWCEALAGVLASRFAQRLADQYGLPAPPHTPGTCKAFSHLGGHPVWKFQEVWFNIPATFHALLAVLGVLTQQHGFLDAAKRFAKEWLMFAVARDGTVADQWRWNETGNPQTGYGYAATALGSVLTIADHLARLGDRELYQLTTSYGLYGWDGGPKSLLVAMQRLAQLGLAERDLVPEGAAYAQTEGPELPAQRLGPGPTSVAETVLLPAQLYYQDPTVAAVLARPRPTTPTAGGYDPWGGDWGCYPSLPFMWDGLAGVVWPYP